MGGGGGGRWGGGGGGGGGGLIFEDLRYIISRNFDAPAIYKEAV